MVAVRVGAVKATVRTAAVRVVVRARLQRRQQPRRGGKAEAAQRPSAPWCGEVGRGAGQEEGGRRRGARAAAGRSSLNGRYINNDVRRRQ